MSPLRLVSVLAAGFLLAGAIFVGGAKGASTHPPLARLSVPTLGIERAIFSGEVGLAVVNHLSGTAQPGEDGNAVLTGRCGGALDFIRRLPENTEIVVETGRGRTERYAVRYAQVLDEGESWIVKQEGPTRLTLITCLELESLRLLGAKYYAVSAYALSAVAESEEVPTEPTPLGREGGVWL